MSTGTINIGTEKAGARVYITGNTYTIKDRLKSAGCHWDGDRKQWWIGSAKADDITSIIGNIASGPPPKEDLSRKPVYGKAEYKGRTYYIIARSDRTQKIWLTVLDGSIDFWAAMDQCRIVKTYQPREYRGRSEYQTLGGLASFVANQRQAESDGLPACAECGRRSDDLVSDLEDGAMKCRRCCDIEPN